MEEDLHVAPNPNFIPDSWLLDVDNPSSPPPAKKKLSLFLMKKTSQSSASRFAPLMSEVDCVEAAKGVLPTSMKKNNAWGGGGGI